MTNTEMHQYIISQPTKDDASALAAMHSQSWLDTYPNDNLGISIEYIKNRIADRVSDEGIKKRQAFIQESYDNPAYFLRIAKDYTGKIVGFIDGRLKDDHYELSGLYTIKETYGSGLGKSLWNVYLAWTGDEKDIILTVATYNERARAFYAKLGFQDMPGTNRYFDESIIPVVDMKRTAS